MEAFDKMTSFKIDQRPFFYNEKIVAFSLKSLLISIPIFPSFSQARVQGVPVGLTQSPQPPVRIDWFKELSQDSPKQMSLNSQAPSKQIDSFIVYEAVSSAPLIEFRNSAFAGSSSERKTPKEEISDKSLEDSEEVLIEINLSF